MEGSFLKLTKHQKLYNNSKIEGEKKTQSHVQDITNKQTNEQTSNVHVTLHIHYHLKKKKSKHTENLPEYCQVSNHDAKLEVDASVGTDNH